MILRQAELVEAERAAIASFDDQDCPRCCRSKFVVSDRRSVVGALTAIVETVCRFIHFLIPPHDIFAGFRRLASSAQAGEILDGARRLVASSQLTTPQGRRDLSMIYEAVARYIETAKLGRVCSDEHSCDS